MSPLRGRWSSLGVRTQVGDRQIVSGPTEANAGNRSELWIIATQCSFLPILNDRVPSPELVAKLPQEAPNCRRFSGSPGHLQPTIRP